VNGGFMLFETAVLNLILSENRETLDLERDILPQLAQQQQLMLYQHSGYWQSMKTLQDYNTLKEAWQTKQPWRVW
ncbi:MAG: glucose-1-phosphate cytidylyltransferase, partial [Anaerolineae bacterium]|nr:glucose-1-phosphate cytidylyltransferase [Anaerolineae bacterium]